MVAENGMRCVRLSNGHLPLCLMWKFDYSSLLAPLIRRVWR